jgi:hypothetical protein
MRHFSTGAGAAFASGVANYNKGCGFGNGFGAGARLNWGGTGMGVAAGSNRSGWRGSMPRTAHRVEWEVL